MTVEEIERILQTVAENQAKHDEMHSRHSADMAEIDREIAMLLKSQNRYEERLATINDIMHDLADKHLKNEERFAETDKRFTELAAAHMRYEARQEQLEASYQLFEEFVAYGSPRPAAWPDRGVASRERGANQGAGRGAGEYGWTDQDAARQEWREETEA